MTHLTHKTGILILFRCGLITQLQQCFAYSRLFALFNARGSSKTPLIKQSWDEGVWAKCGITREHQPSILRIMHSQQLWRCCNLLLIETILPQSSFRQQQWLEVDQFLVNFQVPFSHMNFYSRNIISRFPCTTIPHLNIWFLKLQYNMEWTV